jgi:hypothetical protein
MFILDLDFLSFRIRIRFHCVGGCWDQAQDCCDFGIDSQTI